MNASNGNAWKAVLLLSVIVPLSFIVAFGLYGSSTVPAMISQTFQLETVRWEMERPPDDLEVGYSLDAAYLGDIIVNETVVVEGYSDYGWGDSPLLDSYLNITAELPTGHIEDLSITYADDYPNSTVWLSTQGRLFASSGLAQKGYMDLSRGSPKAYAYFEGVNEPKHVFLRRSSQWLLYSSYNWTQSLEMQVAITYFNGTDYNRLIQPIEIRLTADNANSFSEAKEITIGQTIHDILGGDEDMQDYFKTYLTSGEQVNVTMAHPTGVSFGLSVFSPYNTSYPAWASQTGFQTRACSMSFTADVTGWWFIAVKNLGGCGFYYLTLDRPRENSG